MIDQLDVLKLVAERLEGARIPYMVTGSMAMSLYAEPRFTRDIDLVVDLAPTDAGRVAGLFESEFYVDAESVKAAVLRSGMTNLIHRELAMKVDLIIRKNTPYRLEEFERRRELLVEGARIWMVTPEDLVLSKLVWMKDSRSEMQRRDIDNLLEAVSELDRGYIEKWAPELSVLTLWREIAE